MHAQQAINLVAPSELTGAGPMFSKRQAAPWSKGNRRRTNQGATPGDQAFTAQVFILMVTNTGKAQWVD
jgi:hypothetical protein